MNYPTIVFSLLATLGIATAQATDIGESAPQFILPSLQQDQSTTLHAFAGKVVYLDFLASWCAPCRSSFPLLNALHKKTKSARF